MQTHIKVFLTVCVLLMAFTISYCDNIIGHRWLTPYNGSYPSLRKVVHDSQDVRAPRSLLIFERTNTNNLNAADHDNAGVNKKTELIVSGSVDTRKNVSSVHNRVHDYPNSDAPDSKSLMDTENMKNTQGMYIEARERKDVLPKTGQGSFITSLSGAIKDIPFAETEEGISSEGDNNNDEKENFEMHEALSHVSESNLLGDNDDIDADVEVSRWNATPVDYYKCGKCICHDLSNGANVHVNCDNLKFRVIPDKLPKNTTYLQLNHNHIHFELNKLSHYKSLLTLALNSNNIRSIQNTTCSVSLILHTLDLSDNEIWTIDDYSFACLPRLQILFLQNNNIVTLTNFMLGGLHGLQRVDLSKNLLDTIESNAFVTVHNLRGLNLSKNKNMTYAAKKLNATTFKPLKQLEDLRIHGFGKTAGKYPIAVLLELERLKELSIDGVAIGYFESNLTALANLSTLKIGVDDGHCKIVNLTESYFIGLPNLRRVFLTGCEPNHISPLAFKANKLLEQLVYSEMAYEFDCLFESLAGLQNTSIKSLTINYVRKHTKRTACRILDDLRVKYIKNMHNLTELILENNIISRIDYDFLVNLPKTLQKLSVRKNTLHYLRSVINNKGISALINLVEVKEDMQNHVIFFDRVELEGSSEAEATNCTPQVCSAQPTTQSSSSLSSTSVADSQSPSYGSSLPKNLRHYSASQSFSFGDMLFSRSITKNKVRFFNISNSYITDWGKRTLASEIEVVDLSDNFCDNLKTSFFLRNSSLRELHAAGNFLGDIFEKDLKGKILARLHRVRFIDFSRNHIRELPSLIFSGLVKVQVIKLSNNKLRSFNVTMSHMKSLTFLDLSQNSISWIGKQSQDDLDNINLHNEVSLDLTSNRLPCTCAGLEVMQWLATTNVRIIKKDFLECENENNEVILIGDLQDRVIALQRRCVSRTLIILLITFTMLLVLLIALGTWMFRNRWKLYYLRNIAIAKFLGYKPDDEGQGDNYKFDAYILYSKQDSNFAMGECLKELETKRGHKLCVEHRDFMLGSYMPLTITNAISCSRMTIPVITPDLWESEWCEYGVQIAVMESTHTKRDVLHLLIYKPVPVDTMPRNLIKVLKENSFSEYPPEACEENVRTAFWDALSRTIGHMQVDDQ